MADIKVTIDPDDPFRYDPIGNFKKLAHPQKFHAICVQKGNIRMYEFEHAKLMSQLKAKVDREMAEREAGTIYETRQELFDAYITGEISDETYDEQLRIIEKKMPTHWRLNDRLTWLELMLREQRAIYDAMWDIYRNESPKKLPKEYGYDPRKRVSKYNYPREDWGKTREHIYEHIERKRAIDKRRSKGK